MIELPLANANVKVYLDTGASLNVMENDLAEEIIRNGLGEAIDQECLIFGANGAKFKSTYKLRTTVKIGDEVATIDFSVIDDVIVPTKIILGYPFMDEKKIVIDFNKHVVFKDLFSYPFINPNNKFIFSEGQTIGLHLTSDVKISGGHKILYPVSINGGGEAVIINSCSKYLKSKGIVVNSQVLNPITLGKVTLVLQNNSPTDAELEANAPLCTVTQVHKIPMPEEHIKCIEKLGYIEYEEIDKVPNHRISTELHQANLLAKLIESNDEYVSQKLAPILKEHHEAFARHKDDIGVLKHANHIIKTKDNTPVYVRPYRAPHSKKVIIQDEVQRLLDNGVISPSMSPYSAPCLLVLKKNGEHRLVIDYRALNKNVVPCAHPLPHIDHSLHVVGGNRYFSALDLASGYHQIPLDPETKHKTAFSTGAGLYHFNRVPFGLITSASAMQRNMEIALSDLNGKACLVYVDDILVVGRNLEEHNKHLKQVLERLIKVGFKLNLDKCEFAKEQVSCLGHVINKDGIKPAEDKVKALRDKPLPKNLKALRGFLGLSNFYRKYIEGYAKIAQPLNKLLRKDTKWKWTQDCTDAVENIKKAISKDSCLTHPDFSKEFKVTTDASGEAIGAVLSQEYGGKDRPIAFFSRTLRGPELNYATFEKEGLAVKSALNKWRFYLLGYPVTVQTDNAPIISLLRSRECSGRIGRYLPTILEYNPSFIHVPGKDNFVADYLSRFDQIPENDSEGDDQIPKTEENIRQEANKDYTENNEDEKHVCALEVFQPWTLEELKAAQRDSGWTKDIIIMLEDPSAPKPVHLRDYHLDRDILFTRRNKEGTKLCIPPKLKEKALELIHVHLGKHEGINRSSDRAEKEFTWPSMRKDVEKYVKQCRICLTYKPSNLPRAVLRAYPEVAGPFERVAMDLMGPLPRTSSGKTFIFVATDVFSHWTEIVPLQDKSTWRVAKAFTDSIINRHGAVKQILTDGGSEFKSELMSHICKRMGVNKLQTSAYHPSSNGLVERINAQVGNTLRCITQENPRDWDSFLPQVQFALNSAHHGGIGDSPYFILYGRDPPLPLPELYGIPCQLNMPENMPDRLQRYKICYDKVRECYKKAFTKYSTYHNRSSRDKKITLGDLVFVKMPRPVGKMRKFKKRFKGPYRVTKVLPNGTTFKLKCLVTNKTLSRHMDSLKLAAGSNESYEPFPRSDNLISQDDEEVDDDGQHE